MTDETGALWIPSPNYWQGRNGNTPRWIILHGTAGGTSAQNIAGWFAQSTAQVSAHYVVGQDGTIVQCVLEQDSAWANGIITAGHDPWWSNTLNPNLLTISIEHVKPSSDNSDVLTTTQQQASFGLIKAICQRWQIPARQADVSGGITGHFSLDPVNRARCPGTYPWSDLWQFLQGEDEMLQITDPFAAKYFTQTSATCWHCPATGCDIHDAILDYWRRTQGAFRLPRTNEIYGAITGGGSMQIFEAGVLVYDPQGKFDNPGLGIVYAMHLDENTPGLQQLMKLAGVSGTATSAPTSAPPVASVLPQIAQLAQQIIKLSEPS